MDPRYKLVTFRNLSWEERWILTEKMSIERIYSEQYAPITTDEPEEDIALNELQEDEDEAVFGSSQLSALSENTPSELCIYLEDLVESRKVYIYIST